MLTVLAVVAFTQQRNHFGPKNTTVCARIRTAVSCPALVQRVTVLGSTENIAATSAGLNRGFRSTGPLFTVTFLKAFRGTRQTTCPSSATR